MPPNSVVKTSLIVGGLTFLGLLAGGRLGSMLGAVIGTVVCSMINVEEPIRDTRDENPRFPLASLSNTNRNSKKEVNKFKNELSECSICLEKFKASFALLPCLHTCFCNQCFEEVKKNKMSSCPICRKKIENVMYTYPS